MRETNQGIRETNIISPTCRERFLPLDRPEGEDLRQRFIFMGGLSELHGAYRQERRDPGFHLLLYTINGAGELETPRLRTAMRAGDLLIAPAHHAYCYWLARRSWHIVWFHLKVRPIWKCLDLMEPILIKSESCELMHGAAEGYWSTVRKPALANLTRHYAALICGYIEHVLRPAGRPTRDHELEPLWAEVEAGLHFPWDVAKLARRMRVSPGHLHRLVRKREGLTPMQVVQRLRMARARLLLQDAEEQVKSVAGKVGYESPFAFSAAYKRHFGVAPRKVHG